MAQYIDKDVLVAEIESKFQKYYKRGEESDVLQDGNNKYWGGVLSCLNEVKTLVNTLEVKEVDLEKEISNYLYSHLGRPRMALEFDWTQCDIEFKADKLIAFAKYFFELGLKAQKGE